MDVRLADVRVRTARPRVRVGRHDADLHQSLPFGQKTRSGLVDSLVTAKPLLAHLSLSSLLGHAAPRALHRIADHGPPLLLRDAVEVLAERPVSSFGSGRAFVDGAP